MSASDFNQPLPPECREKLLSLVGIAAEHGNLAEAIAACRYVFTGEGEGTVTEASPVGAIGLRLRIANVIEGAGIETVGELCSCTQLELRTLPNLGELAAREVAEKLRQHGFEMRENRVALKARSA